MSKVTEYIGYEKESEFPIFGGEHPKIAVLTDTEVIRCRDCKHFDPNVDEYIGEDGSNPKCNRLTYVFEKYHGGVEWLHRPTVSPDGFCAWAERDA